MQPDEPIYSERQRFHPQDGTLLAVLWLVILTSPTFFLWAIVQQIVMDSPVGNNPANDFVLIVLALIFGIGLPLFMYTMGLDTQVRESGIFVRFWPFHRNGSCLGLIVSRKRKLASIVHSKTMEVGASVMGERARHTTLVETRESF